MLKNFFANTQKSNFTQSKLGNNYLNLQYALDDDDILNSKIIIFYVGELGLKNVKNFERIMYSLQNLKKFSDNIVLLNLGEFIVEQNPEETFSKLKLVFQHFFQYKINSICITQLPMVSYAMYAAAEELHTNISFSFINENIKIEPEDGLQNVEPIFKILEHQPIILKNINFIAHQNYFSDIDSTRLLEKLSFDFYRLGEIRNQLHICEPALRESDFVHFDLHSLNNCMITGVNSPSPNGLYPEEACQLMRFAGMSPNVKCMSLHGFNSENDKFDLTVKMIAQLIWHYLEGFEYRNEEIPKQKNNDFMEYIVHIDKHIDLVFVKSKKTDRWWMLININQQQFWEPCSYNDYLTASNGEIPNRYTQSIIKHS
jgi:formiminoglutamase